MITKRMSRTFSMILAVTFSLCLIAMPASAVATAKQNSTNVWDSPDNAGDTNHRTAILNKGDQINGTTYSWPQAFPSEIYIGNEISYCARDSSVEGYVAWGHTLLFTIT